MTRDTLRVQVRTYCLHMHDARPRNDGCSSEDTITDLLKNWARFASQHRFVDFQTGNFYNLSVSRDLIAE